MSNIRLFMGTIIIAIALLAQFYPKKFPKNKDFLIGCIVLYPFWLITFMVLNFHYPTDTNIVRLVNTWLQNTYVVFNGLLQFLVYTKEKNAILFTYPPEVIYLHL